MDFNLAKGGERGKLRPALLLSDEDAAQLLPTVMVLPLSTQLLDDAQPYRFRLFPRDQLEKSSDVCVNEIRALSKERLKTRIGQVTPTEYEAIRKCLCQLV